VEVDPENLNHGRCVAKCPEEFKEDTSDKNVRKCVTVCGDNCLDCEKSLCRRCKENYYLTAEHRCVNSCGEGYFQDNVKRECAECGVNFCKTCSAVGVCTQCANDYAINEKTKSCEKIPQAQCSSTVTCASGSFCDKKTNACVKCHFDCAECMGPSFDHCTRCKNHQLLDARTRQCPSCKPGHYFDSETNNCFSCSQNCLVCSKSACVQCMPGYGLGSMGSGLGRCLECCKPDAERKYDCAICPLAATQPDSGHSVAKIIVFLCIGGVAFFFFIFGLLMWKDRNYERDAKKYAYSKVPILYDIGNDSQLVVEDEKRYENGALIHSDGEDDFDTGADGDEDTIFDKKVVTNGR